MDRSSLRPLPKVYIPAESTASVVARVPHPYNLSPYGQSSANNSHSTTLQSLQQSIAAVERRVGDKRDLLKELGILDNNANNLHAPMPRPNYRYDPPSPRASVDVPSVSSNLLAASSLPNIPAAMPTNPTTHQPMPASAKTPRGGGRRRALDLVDIIGKYEPDSSMSSSQLQAPLTVDTSSSALRKVSTNVGRVVLTECRRCFRELDSLIHKLVEMMVGKGNIAEHDILWCIQECCPLGIGASVLRADLEMTSAEGTLFTHDSTCQEEIQRLHRELRECRNQKEDVKKEFSSSHTLMSSTLSHSHANLLTEISRERKNAEEATKQLTKVVDQYGESVQLLSASRHRAQAAEQAFSDCQLRLTQAEKYLEDSKATIVQLLDQIETERRDAVDVSKELMRRLEMSTISDGPVSPSQLNQKQDEEFNRLRKLEEDIARYEEKCSKTTSDLLQTQQLLDDQKREMEGTLMEMEQKLKIVKEKEKKRRLDLQKEISLLKKRESDISNELESLKQKYSEAQSELQNEVDKEREFKKAKLVIGSMLRDAMGQPVGALLRPQVDTMDGDAGINDTQHLDLQNEVKLLKERIIRLERERVVLSNEIIQNGKDPLTLLISTNNNNSTDYPVDMQTEDPSTAILRLSLSQLQRDLVETQHQLNLSQKEVSGLKFAITRFREEWDDDLKKQRRAVDAVIKKYSNASQSENSESDNRDKQDNMVVQLATLYRQNQEKSISNLRRHIHKLEKEIAHRINSEKKLSQIILCLRKRIETLAGHMVIHRVDVPCPPAADVETISEVMNGVTWQEGVEIVTGEPVSVLESSVAEGRKRKAASRRVSESK